MSRQRTIQPTILSLYSWHWKWQRKCIGKVKRYYNALDLPFCEVEIDRVHRITKKCKDKNSGKKVKSIIIKFKSWKSWQQFCNARPRIAKKKPGQNSTVLVDLTRRHYLLLKKARGAIKNNEAINFVIAKWLQRNWNLQPLSS